MRTVFSPLVFLAFLVSAATASAQAIGWPKLVTPKEDVTWSVGLKLGPYRPRIAQDPNHAAVQHFNSMFAGGLGNTVFDHGPPLKMLELEYYFTDAFGRLGLGFGVGHWEINGRSRVCHDSSGNAVSCAGVSPTDSANSEGNTPVSLTVVPMTVQVVYRADQFMRHWDIPLMPYVKGGLDYHVWFARTGGATAMGPNQAGVVSKGEGGTWGWHGTAGLALNLNWLDPTEKRTESAMGLVAGHLFAEGTYLGIDGFGASPNVRLDLSDLTFAAGLIVDFE